MSDEISHAELMNFTSRQNWNSWQNAEVYGLSSSFARSFNDVRAAGRLPLAVLHKMKDRDATGGITSLHVPKPPGFISALARRLSEQGVGSLDSNGGGNLPGLPDLDVQPELFQIESSTDPALRNGFQALRHMMLVAAIAATEALNKDSKALIRALTADGRLPRQSDRAWEEKQLFASQARSGFEVSQVLRHVLAHRGGLFDQKAVEQLSKLSAAKVSVGDPVALRATEGRVLIEACIAYGLECLAITDGFLTAKLLVNSPAGGAGVGSA